jgi:hypothetical protein
MRKNAITLNHLFIHVRCVSGTLQHEAYHFIEHTQIRPQYLPKERLAEATYSLYGIYNSY